MTSGSRWQRWMRTLAPGAGVVWPCHSIRKLVIFCSVMVLLGGVLLALPTSWQGHHPYDADLPLSQQNLYTLSTHGLNCLFMACASITGTGLVFLDVGRDFSMTGQVIILSMMELGACLWLVMSTAVGWRLRMALGWGSPDDSTSQQGMNRILVVVLSLFVLFQVVGVVLFLPSAEAWFPALFQSVSAWTNHGFTLHDEVLAGTSTSWTLYSLLGSSMWIGALGGPIWFELFTRLIRRRKASWSFFFKITLACSLLSIVAFSGLIYFIESTRLPHWQMRFEAEGKPGHLTTATSEQADEPIVFSSTTSERAQRERLYSMPPTRRAFHSLFLSLQTSGPGMRNVRLDDESISSASRVVLYGLMFVGGVGWISITALLACMWRGVRSQDSQADHARWRAYAASGVMLVFVGLLIASVTLALTYRQPDSLERCLFEAVSACSHVGLSCGLAEALPFQDHTPGPLFLRFSGRIVLILGMILGRLIPLAVVLRLVVIDQGDDDSEGSSCCGSSNSARNVSA